MSFPLDIGRLAREIQIPFEQVARRFPLSASASNFRQVPQASVYLNAATNHTSSGSWQKMPLDTTTKDTGTDTAQFSDANDRLVCYVPGLYVVVGSAGFAQNGTGVRGMQLYKNGNAWKKASSIVGTASSTYEANVTAVERLAVGDYVEVFTYQGSGGNLAYEVGATVCSLAWAWLSP